MRLSECGVTVKDRIILHLLDHWGSMHQGVWPAALTQNGIADAVGISRSHVAVTIPDLIQERLVESHLERVEGRQRRVKVYSLTHVGGQWAGHLVQRLLPTVVIAVDDSGEWETPLDGLIQVNRVHMLTALGGVGEDNRIDLRELPASGPEVKAEAGVTEVEGTPEEAGEGPEVAEAHKVVGEAPPGPIEVEALEDAKEAAMEEPPTGPPMAVPVVHTPGPPGGYPYQQAFWSPLRYGSGRRPSAGMVVGQAVVAFFMITTAVITMPLDPLLFLPISIMLIVLGAVMGAYALSISWALGERREQWVATILAAYAFPAVLLVSFASFGDDTYRDLAMLAMLLGVPSLVLTAGSGKNVERRGRFALMLGPVVVVVGFVLLIIDTGEGASGALGLLATMVGASWTFVGWTMVRKLEDARPAPLVVAGGAIGLSIAAVASAAELWREGRLEAPVAGAVALWVASGAWVAALSLLPRLAPHVPSARASYSVLAVTAAAGLLTAAALFLVSGMALVGLAEAVMAVAMVAMVATDLMEGGTHSYALASWGAVVAAFSVLVLLPSPT